MSLMRGQCLHRAEILMRLGHLVACEASVMFPLQAIKHPDITHRHHQPRDGFCHTGGDHAPARRFIPGWIGASSQAKGQKASSEVVEGAKRERLSNKFWKVEQASIHRISA